MLAVDMHVPVATRLDSLSKSLAKLSSAAAIAAAAAARDKHFDTVFVVLLAPLLLHLPGPPTLARSAMPKWPPN